MDEEKNTEEFVGLNGEIRKRSAVRIDPFDPGFLLGNGIFETLLAEEGRPVRFRRHYRRMAASAAFFRLPLPPPEELESHVTELLGRNRFQGAKVRITLSGLPPAPVTLTVQTLPLPGHPESSRVVTVPFRRNAEGALAGHKSTSYAENLAALAFARERGADDAVLLNTRGDFCEGATTNLFFLRDDTLFTPPLSSGCLPGTMREIVIEVCGERNIALLEKDIPAGEAPQFPRAFLTSSLRGIQPIHRFDDRRLETDHPILPVLREAIREKD